MNAAAEFFKIAAFLLLVYLFAFAIDSGQWMRRQAWRLLAFVVCLPPVTRWLIARAKRTPYYPIRGADGSVYMDRWWLFNPYRKDANGDPLPSRWPRLPSVRVHHIMRADSDDHDHNHPWLARTVVLKGWYEEERAREDVSEYDWRRHVCGYIGDLRSPAPGDRVVLERWTGYTGLIQPNDFHRITRVSHGGVYTLFFTWGASQGWGFRVDGRVVPWREYLGVEEAH